MFIPPKFHETQTKKLFDLIETNPLGILITQSTDGLNATPVPFVAYPKEGASGVLRTHVAKANPIYNFEEGKECLIFFQGENGYVTPSWYESKTMTPKVVPTWNYVAVMAKGVPKIHEDPTWLKWHLNDMVRNHESTRSQPWSITDAPEDFVNSQIKVLVGIEIYISHIEGKWKLSQNKSDRDRKGVIAGMLDENDPHHNVSLARRMVRP